MTVRMWMTPFCRTSATRVWGMPLPLASGKYLKSSQPPTSEPTSGLRTRWMPPAVSRTLPMRSVRATKATTIRPTTALMTKREEEQNLVLMLSKIDSRQPSLHWSKHVIESPQTGSHYSTLMPATPASSEDSGTPVASWNVKANSLFDHVTMPRRTALNTNSAGLCRSIFSIIRQR